MSTRGQIETRKGLRERFITRAGSYKATTNLGVHLIEVAAFALQMSDLEDNVPKEEIEQFIVSGLPPVQSIFTDEYFDQPAFPVRLLKDVAALYDVLPMSGDVMSSLGVPLQMDPVAICHAWLASILDPDPAKELVKRVIEKYKLTKSVFFQKVSSVGTLRDPTPEPNTSGQVPPPVTVPRSDIQAPDHRGDVREVVSHSTDRRSGHVHQDRSRSQGLEDIPSEFLEGVTPNEGSGHRNQISPTQNRHADNGPEIKFDSTKKASSVHSYFKDSKFTGDRSSTEPLLSIHHTIRDYEVCANQLQLTPKQKADYFINAFAGSAREFFFENCNMSMTYRQLVDVMLTEYDSDARQLEAQAEVESLSLETLMEQEEITNLNIGLDHLITKINTLTPQCPREFRSNKNKVRFLRSAVIKQRWADQAVGQITTAKLNYNQFVTALREQLQLHLERSSQDPETPTSTLYQQYGRKPYKPRGRKQVRFSNGSSRKNPFDKHGKRMLCHVCGSDEHLANFHKNNGIRDDVRDKLEKGVPTLNIVHELVSALENLSRDHDEDHPRSEENGDEDPAVTNHVTASPSVVEQFDILSAGQTDEDKDLEVGFFEELDKAVAINHLKASVSDDVDQPNVTHLPVDKDF